MRGAAPDKPGGGLISEEELAEKNAAANGGDAAADGHVGGDDQAVAIEPVDAKHVDKVSPLSSLCAMLLATRVPLGEGWTHIVIQRSHMRARD